MNRLRVTRMTGAKMSVSNLPELPEIKDAEQAAVNVLEATWCEDLSACVPPVDPFSIAETLGLRVDRVVLEPDVSGMLAKRPHQEPIVYVNRADSNVRQRFSCAHEIGHYMNRTLSANDDEEWGYIDRRGPSARAGTEPDEMWANQFAAELLMPRLNVQRMSAEHRPLVLMARAFEVSVDAMRFRCENLQLPIY